MKKIESIYREILYKALELKEFELTQSELSKKLGISLSIVNSAVKRLNSIGSVRIQQRGFRVIDIKKILYFWASVRNLEKDIIYKTRIEVPVREIERIMPNLVFTCYTGYKFMFNDVPADYSEVYVYADEGELQILKERIKKISNIHKKENLYVLKKDPLLILYKNIPLAQIFADLWNVKDWYAKDFIDAFEKKLKEQEKK